MSGGRPLDVALRHPRLHLDRKGLAATIALLDAHAGRFQGGCPPGRLSIAFLTDRELARLHADFLGDPSPTDVITFPGAAGAELAGEICVSVDAAARRAGTPARRLAGELVLYVIHGWLHLAGYDDREAPARRSMRRAEARALRLVARSRPPPRFRLA